MGENLHFTGSTISEVYTERVENYENMMSEIMSESPNNVRTKKNFRPPLSDITNSTMNLIEKFYHLGHYNQLTGEDTNQDVNGNGHLYCWKNPKFAQLYIYDTSNEIENRLFAIRTDNSNLLDPEIISNLKRVLDQHNPLVKSLRMAVERFKSNDCRNLKLRLIHNRERDGKRYNLPTANEIAALIPGDIDSEFAERDIILETQYGDLKRISELHPAYIPLQYPLLFPYGEDDYRVDVSHSDSSLSHSSQRTNVMVREWMAFRYVHYRVPKERVATCTYLTFLGHGRQVTIPEKH
ncbi:ATP-dependent DNA helicase PIF1 [Senna tora]|uniref:ATP-dependent DNA helicase PIF1 n=1 Tax=Senna tora TaxID=362788 RepID=A0A834SFI5_9FABA|nr:ATP-dependent DNA helicase PIF1 [Senna tora]